MIVLFNKPYRVLSQFTTQGNKKTLADFIDISNIYAAGRLDYDSEGLMILTDDGRLQQRIANPRYGKDKEYWVQVEGMANEQQLEQLRQGITLKDGPTRPARVERIPEPDIGQRIPPIRKRTNIPTSWLKIVIREGRNRQVRRMTAHVGLPTLRLFRYRIGKWEVGSLAPGHYRIEGPGQRTAYQRRTRPVSR
jgi:23S rRNA pseudouridine2457 synthase